MSANQYYNQGPPGPPPQATYVLSALAFSGSICCACGELGRDGDGDGRDRGSRAIGLD
jgi:hypothetical protein